MVAGHRVGGSTVSDSRVVATIQQRFLQPNSNRNANPHGYSYADIDEHANAHLTANSDSHADRVRKCNVNGNPDDPAQLYAEIAISRHVTPRELTTFGIAACISTFRLTPCVAAAVRIIPCISTRSTARATAPRCGRW
jgi:hypothetical protein